MPDVHLGADVCIGVAIATTQLIYPQAVGGDIGCGILAVPFDVGADCIADSATAARLLADVSRAVPGRLWRAVTLPLIDVTLPQASAQSWHRR